MMIIQFTIVKWYMNLLKIPEGFAMTCIWGDYSYPTMWIDRLISARTYGNASYEWINTGTARLVVDGIYDWHCNGNINQMYG